MMRRRRLSGFRTERGGRGTSPARSGLVETGVGPCLNRTIELLATSPWPKRCRGRRMPHWPGSRLLPGTPLTAPEYADDRTELMNTLRRLPDRLRPTSPP